MIDNVLRGFLYFLLGFSAVMIGYGIYSVLTAPTYADGYCTALGGEKISAEICNVNGKVVEVK